MEKIGDVEFVKIMGYGGGPGCAFGNTYYGKYAVEPQASGLLKFTASEEGFKAYESKASDKLDHFVFPDGRKNRAYSVPKGSVFYVSACNIQEMG